MSGSLTTDKSVLSHLKPLNIQVWFEDADFDALRGWKFLLGLADYDGSPVYDPMRAKMGDFQPVNDNGELVYPRRMGDPRGGAITLVAQKFGTIDQVLNRRHVCRYGRVDDGRVFFKASIVRASETDTSTAASDKTTVGGKVGVSYGIGSGEVSGSREHQGAGGSVASTYAGQLRDITVVWSQKP